MDLGFLDFEFGQNESLERLGELVLAEPPCLQTLDKFLLQQTTFPDPKDWDEFFHYGKSQQTYIDRKMVELDLDEWGQVSERQDDDLERTSLPDWNGWKCAAVIMPCENHESELWWTTGAVQIDTKMYHADLIVPDSRVSEPHIVYDEDRYAGLDPEAARGIDQVLTRSKSVHSISNLRPLSSPKSETRTQFAFNVELDDIEERFSRLKLAMEFPFELDTFQKRAIELLERGENVFVSAHTSSGKTVVAEYAVALSICHQTKTIYTCPIKALGNQKFRDFQDKFGKKVSVGLITGDALVNPQGDCLIMTTEILRSMLYKGSSVLSETEFVVFDEVHYINDLERGVVWEEVFILLPPRITLILLSATTPNTLEFADWIGRIRQRKVWVINTLHRPIPLEHYVYGGNELVQIVDSKRSFKESNFDRVTGSSKRDPVSFDQQFYRRLINLLSRRDLLPAVVFTFSRKQCETNAGFLDTMDLTVGSEKHQIKQYLEARFDPGLKSTDLKLPQIMRVKDGLMRGISVHHSGVLPVLKEAIEILFARGYIKVLFATETFAMGLNMPTKTVVFTDTRKHDGYKFRDITCGEYTQMSGRAGRRGMDRVGTVVILVKHPLDIYCTTQLRNMILGAPRQLQSQFRLTYNMILSILRTKSIHVSDVLRKTFLENRPAQLQPSRSRVECRCTFECNCARDADVFYQCFANLRNLSMAIHSKYLYYYRVFVRGRVFLTDTDQLAILLSCNTNSTIFECLVADQEVEIGHFDGYDLGPHEDTLVWIQSIFGRLKSSQLFHTNMTTQKIEFSRLAFASTLKLNLPLGETIDLAKIGETLKESIGKGHLSFFVPDSMDPELQRLIKDKKENETRFLAICPWAILHHAHQIDSGSQGIGDQPFLSVFYLEYNCRIECLRRLDYLDRQTVLQVKGQVAAELTTTDELLATELLFNNFFSDFTTEECVALISAFVFQERTETQYLPTRLAKGRDTMLKLASDLGDFQRGCGLEEFIVHSTAERLNFGLVLVVYKWALGMDFRDIMTATDTLEGVIVKTITRLDEALREIASAARIMGDAALVNKLELGSRLIKRDICFAGSLYL